MITSSSYTSEKTVEEPQLFGISNRELGTSCDKRCSETLTVFKDFDLNSTVSYTHQKTNSGRIFPTAQKASRMF